MRYVTLCAEDILNINNAINRLFNTITQDYEPIEIFTLRGILEQYNNTPEIVDEVLPEFVVNYDKITKKLYDDFTKVNSMFVDNMRICYYYIMENIKFAIREYELFKYPESEHYILNILSAVDNDCEGLNFSTQELENDIKECLRYKGHC